MLSLNKVATFFVALSVACLCLCGVSVEARKEGRALLLSKHAEATGRVLSGDGDFGLAIEMKQAKLKKDLKDSLKVMRKERKAIASSSKKVEKVADEAEDISDKWRDIQVALLELYNVKPRSIPEDDDFFKQKVDEVRNHLAGIVESAKSAASKMQDAASQANEAADAFVDSDLKTEEGDLGSIAEVEDVEQEIAEVAQRTAEEGEEIAEEADDLAEAAENAKDQLDDFIKEVEDGDKDKMKDALEALQQMAEDETEMAEQLEEDASEVASEGEQAAIKAEIEKQNIIQEAENLGVDITTDA